jgi:hypothetical protein
LNIEVRKREEYYLETRYGELSSREWKMGGKIEPITGNKGNPPFDLSQKQILCVAKIKIHWVHSHIW